MEYIVYRITNLQNGKRYIGAHQTSDVNDSYMSSSKVVKAAINKYGKEHFIKEVLYTFDNAEDMFAKEAELVNEDFVKRTDTYNLKTGGTGSTSHLNTRDEAHSKRCSDAAKAQKNRYDISQHGDEYRFGVDAERTARIVERSKSPESRAKRKETFKRLGHQQGSKNSNYGSVWCIEIGSDNKKEKKLFKPDQIPKGWITLKEYNESKKNKLNNAYGRSWYNDGVKNYFLKRDDPVVNELNLEKRRIR